MARDEERALYRLLEPSPRFELIEDWTVARGPAAARRTVGAPGWSSEDGVVLEERPAFVGRPGSTSSTTGLEFSIASPTDITVRTSSRDQQILLVRNAWDEHWSATVDGRPADVLAANYFVQGVPVAAGEHTVRLTYSDPAIAPGAIGTGISVLILLLGASVAALLERRVQK